jgi:two-component system, NarL family, sensor kinase
VLTAAVIGVYAGIVALGGVLLPTRVGLGTALIATLLIAVAFHPVRVWLQRAVDQAIYGARRDPVRAVAAVGERLGEVGVVGGAGLDGVLEALVRVMRFPWAAVVVAGVEIASFSDPPASRHATPLLRGEETLGELVIGLRTGEARLSANDARVLELLAAPIAAAVQAATLAEELRRSREQVITGREEERRRLRRDLHDGLGPVLTGVVLNAEAALRLLTSDPARSADLLVELRRQRPARWRTSGAWSMTCGRLPWTASAWSMRSGSRRRCWVVARTQLRFRSTLRPRVNCRNFQQRWRWPPTASSPRR